MKNRYSIGILVIIIAFCSAIASLLGIFSTGGQGEYEFKAITEETIKIYGKGIYHYDSVAAATQAIAQDYVTIILGIPLLLFSYLLAYKNKLKGKLLLLGTLGYFLYTYASYSFLAMYNQLFLIYVLIMSASFFAFILIAVNIDYEELPNRFKAQFPRRFIGIFMLMFSTMIFMMWIGRIVPSMIEKSTPIGLEHYSTLIIQALDLGFLVPGAFLGGVLLIKGKPFGYLLAAIIIIKGITLATAVTAMAIGQYLNGIEIGIGELVVFPILNLIMVFCLIVIMKNINEKGVL